MGLVWVKKAERDGRQIGIDTRKMRAKEEMRLRWIIARQLNDFDLTVIIDGEKMGGLAALFLAHKHICLERAWSSILPIIKGRMRPTDERLRTNNEHKHETHA
jgi:hypothetical protein